MTIKVAPTSLDELTNSLLEMDDSQPLSSSDRVNLTAATSYYRSKLFTTFHSINPLIAAASPLLTMITKSEKQALAPPYSTLHKNLVHEMKAFECQTQNHGYRANTILAARYVLCALADELILNTQTDDKLEWKKQTLLQTFQCESSGSDRFFLILERSREDPLLYIDLLELIYVCLRIDFKGKFRDKLKGHEELQCLTDNLYHCIREQRGDISNALSDYKPGTIKKSYAEYKLRLLTAIPGLILLSFLIFFTLNSFKIIT